MHPQFSRLATCLATSGIVALMAGCADGPLPEARYLNPWIRQQWNDDERAITTYHKKVADLAALRSQAARLPAEQQEPLSAQLAARLQEERAPVLRAELVRTLAEFRTLAARTAIQSALADEEASVRIAACKALGRHPAAEAVEPLAQAIGSDSDLDVRLAAATTLGKFTDAELPAEERKRLAQSLRPALDDRDPALQVAAMQSLEAITGRTSYQNNVATWREYLDGANPAPPSPPTLAEMVQRSIRWY
jgi:HEAT repeat protein